MVLGIWTHGLGHIRHSTNWAICPALKIKASHPPMFQTASAWSGKPSIWTPLDGFIHVLFWNHNIWVKNYIEYHVHWAQQGLGYTGDQAKQYRRRSPADCSNSGTSIQHHIWLQFKALSHLLLIKRHNTSLNILVNFSDWVMLKHLMLQ